MLIYSPFNVLEPTFFSIGSTLSFKVLTTWPRYQKENHHHHLLCFVFSRIYIRAILMHRPVFFSSFLLIYLLFLSESKFDKNDKFLLYTNTSDCSKNMAKITIIEENEESKENLPTVVGAKRRFRPIKSELADLLNSHSSKPGIESCYKIARCLKIFGTLPHRAGRRRSKSIFFRHEKERKRFFF